MCGIAGVVWFDGRAVTTEAVQAMTDAVSHRGPDGEGKYVCGPVGLGHRRLSIIDLSAAGGQPMTNEDGSIWLTYNGEIYNFAGLREELEQRGHVFRSATDTEVVIHAYEEWGTECVGRFNGMFAFGLWDGRRRRLWLVRDRLGVKPLFYCHRPQGVYFGSEIKAILADPTVPRRLDYEALNYFLAYNYVPAPHTLFAGIRQLEPGHYALIESSGEMRDVEYWDVTYREDEDRGERAYVEELSALLEDSVRLRLVSDVPFGVFLSGGVDSSGVAYWMARHLSEPVKTFSIGFQESSYNELEFAREVATSIRAEHHERLVTPDASALLPTLVWHAEEPTADSSMLAVYHLAQVTRERVPMVLTGDGGDDILAGYETHQALYAHRMYRWLPRVLRSGVIAPLARALPVSDSKISWECRIKRFVAAAELEPDEAHASWRIIFDAPGRRRLLAGALTRPGATADVFEPYRRAFARTNARHPLNRILYVDTRLYLPADMLVKVDRMTMAHGLEAREPYLDYRLVEFVAAVPPRLKLKALRHKKYLLKAALRGRVPDRVLRRRKQGFNVPKGTWFKNELREFVADSLAPDRVRRTGVLEPAAVDALVREHVDARADNSHQIWSLLVLSSWFEQFRVTP